LQKLDIFGRFLAVFRYLQSAIKDERPPIRLILIREKLGVTSNRMQKELGR